MEQNVKDFLEEERSRGTAYKDIRLNIIDNFGVDYTENHLAVEFWKMKNQNKRIVEEVEETKEVLPEKIELTKKGGALIEKIIELTEEEKMNKEVILSKIVDEPSEWVLNNIKISNWQQHTKEQITKNLYAVKIDIDPVNEVSIDKAIEIAQKRFDNEIKPINFLPRRDLDGLNENLLMEFPAIELHLGKLAWHKETGENYDHKIAKQRFETAIQKTIELQGQQQTSELVYYIGNDFFNSEANNKTTKDTPQQNDVRWQKMFEVGLEIQLEALATLRNYFNKVNVMIVPGNHDRQMTYFLYMALEQAFKNDNIVEFSDNKKLTQVFKWGDCAIFTNHGDVNYKRLVQTLPAEFPKEWGESKFRELHMGHLHTQTAQEESGLTTRRISSPSGTDFWHYEQRFNSSLAGHQLFIWDKYEGLKTQEFITYDRTSKKKPKILVKGRK